MDTLILDNGPSTLRPRRCSTRMLGLTPITSRRRRTARTANGLAAAASSGRFKRDYVNGAELRDAETVLARLGGWFDGYNTQAPHSALGIAKPGRVPGRSSSL